MYCCKFQRNREGIQEANESGLKVKRLARRSGSCVLQARHFADGAASRRVPSHAVSVVYEWQFQCTFECCQSARNRSSGNRFGMDRWTAIETARKSMIPNLNQVRAAERYRNAA